MTPKLKTRDVSKCFHAAQNSFTIQEWNASTINAIHSCIAACDAICVYFLGKRHAGESHEDAVSLFETIAEKGEEINTNANRILRILRIKNMAEYEERLVYKTESEKVLKDCERFLEFVKRKLP